MDGCRWGQRKEAEEFKRPRTADGERFNDELTAESEAFDFRRGFERVI